MLCQSSMTSWEGQGQLPTAAKATGASTAFNPGTPRLATVCMWPAVVLLAASCIVTSCTLEDALEERLVPL